MLFPIEAQKALLTHCLVGSSEDRAKLLMSFVGPLRVRFDFRISKKQPPTGSLLSTVRVMEAVLEWFDGSEKYDHVQVKSLMGDVKGYESRAERQDPNPHMESLAAHVRSLRTKGTP